MRISHKRSIPVLVGDKGSFLGFKWTSVKIESNMLVALTSIELVWGAMKEFYVRLHQDSDVGLCQLTKVWLFKK